MGFSEDSVMMAREWIDATGKKGGELVEAQKIKLAIAKFRSQLSEDYQTLGRLAYDAAKNGTDIDEVHAAIVLAIDEKLEKVSRLQEKLAGVKGMKICSECGFSNPSTAEFCCRCGKKVHSRAYNPSGENRNEEPPAEEKGDR